MGRASAIAGVLAVAALVTIVRQLTLVRDLGQKVDRAVEDFRARA
jgi:hypothetical protein